MKKVLLGFVSMLLIGTLSFSVEVQLWEKWQTALDPTYDEVIKMFEKENTSIKVKRVHYEVEDLRYNFQNAALSGKPPTLVVGPADTVGVYSAMGIIKPIKEVAGFNKKMLDKLVPAGVDQLKIDGELYGVPEQIGNHLTLIYNKKYVTKVPETWDDLIAFSKKFRADNPDKYGIVYNLNEPFWFVGVLGGYGGWVFDAKNKPILNSPAMVKALAFVNKLKFVDKVVPQECDYGVADTLFKEGKAAFIINGDWSYSSYQTALGDNMGLAKVPKVPGGGFYTPMTAVQGIFVAEGLKKDQEEAGYKFIEFITRKDVQLFITSKNKTLPVNKEAAEDKTIKNDAFLSGSVAQMLVGKAMPVIPEMRAVWDAIRPSQEDIMNNKVKPEDAAKTMQSLAEKKIKEMNQ